MKKIHEPVPDGNRRRMLAAIGVAGIAFSVPAVARNNHPAFVDDTIVWLRDRFMQEAQRLLAANGMNNVSADRMGRLAYIMAELPARRRDAIAAKRDVADWEGRVGGERVSYDVMTKFALTASIRQDQIGGAT